MKTLNRETGKAGEEAAANLLLNKGYLILERNWGNKYGEIDIVARDGETVVFCEVKTKKGISFGTPEEMFTPSKLGKVKRMAVMYLKGREVPCRIDMIAVEVGDNHEIKAIRHYPNARES